MAIMKSEDRQADRTGPELDELILRDLASKYSNVRCPVHDVTPGFELASDGSMIERFCCQALSQIFRELRASEIADQVGPEQGEKAREVATLLAGQGAKTLRED